MPSFYTILTDVGQAKLANAIALGQTIDITDLAVGDGNGAMPVPETSRTALVNEVRRAPINLSDVDDQNPTWVVVEQVLPPDVGGWTIREIGVFDIDGDLIGYGNYPETYKPVLAEGSSRTQTIRFVMEVSDTQAITLKVDPSVVLATRGYADNVMATHEASRNHPSGTTDAKGMLRLATTGRVKQYNAADPVTAAALRDSGLLGAAVTSVTAADSPKALTVAEAGLVLVNASVGAVTLNLPPAVNNGGLRYVIIRSDTSANSVSVNPDGTAPDTVNAAASYQMRPGQRLAIVSDGSSNWPRTNPTGDAGAVQPFAMTEPPEGWLECDGSAILRASYPELFAAIGTTHGAGDGATTFNLPDFRGEFLRGWDHGRGVDSGRAFGTAQSDAFRSHRHGKVNVGISGGFSPTTSYEGGISTTDSTVRNPPLSGTYERLNTALEGDAETRPRNVAVMYCIKY